MKIRLSQTQAFDLKALLARTIQPPLSAALNWLVPKRCFACALEIAASAHPCCDACYATLPFQNGSCQHCGQVFAAKQDFCGRCLSAAPPFDACFCAFRYESPIKEQIQRFKYSQKPELAATVAKLLYAEIISNQLVLPDLLIPVPIHISRLRERGYNQAWLITQNLGELINIPCSNTIVEKHKSTPAQATLSLAARKNNNRGSFRLKTPTSARSIAIIDDVFTTGSTAAEITKILKTNGVDYVQIWGVAHTN
ncbi:MAG: ComF family protein [Polaribacter sp.]|jgi:ComF family protein